MSRFPLTRRRALGLGAGALAWPGMAVRAAEERADVLVLGAGISGLHAARMLQAAGLDVAVLEAQSRIGGRCWTARQVPGRPELGASQIGHGYGRVRGNAAELGVTLLDPLPGSPSQIDPSKVAISVDGQPAVAEPWATSARNRLAPQERTISPLQLFGHYINAKAPFTDLGDWLKPEFASLDKMSLTEYFTSQGASPEALRLLNINVSARNLSEANTLDVMRKNYFYRWEAKSGSYSSVQGGMSTLTDAMAASLKRPVQRAKVVQRIEAGAKNVAVACADGSTYRARAAITTIPLSVFKSLRVDAPATAEQRLAWKAIDYTHLVQVFMLPSSPFWEQDGMTAELWTDSSIERVLRLPAPDTPHGLLVAYINGEGADAFDGLSGAAIGDKVLRELVRLRPAAAGNVSVVHVHNWTTQPFALGHVSGYRPGDIGRYEALLARPAGALYFAGEHCGKLHVGLEAACEAAEAAVTRLLEALG